MNIYQDQQQLAHFLLTYYYVAVVTRIWKCWQKDLLIIGDANISVCAGVYSEQNKRKGCFAMAIISRNCSICGTAFSPDKFHPYLTICVSRSCHHERQLKNMCEWRKRNKNYYAKRKDIVKSREMSSGKEAKNIESAVEDIIKQYFDDSEDSQLLRLR